MFQLYISLYYITPNSVVYTYIYFIILMDSIRQIFGQGTERMVCVSTGHHVAYHVLQHRTVWYSWCYRFAYRDGKMRLDRKKDDRL